MSSNAKQPLITSTEPGEDRLSLEDFYRELPAEVTCLGERIGLSADQAGNVFRTSSDQLTEREKSLPTKAASNEFKALIFDDVHRERLVINKQQLKKQRRKQRDVQQALRARQRRNLFRLTNCSKKAKRKAKARGLNGAVKDADHQSITAQASHAGQLRYSVFCNVNRIWRGYMRELIKSVESGKRYTEQVKLQPNKSSVFSLNAEQNLLNCLVKADFHGAQLLVIASRNPNLVGLKGIVLKETRNTFQLINEQNRIFSVAKVGTMFAFEINERIFKLNGNYLHVNAHMRTRLKLKSIKSSIDI